MSQSSILVIEDDPSLNSRLVRVLRERWPHTDGVLSAAEAREWLESSRYDLLLVDLRLPDGDGLQLLRELQRDGLAQRAMVLTGHADPPTVAEALHSVHDLLRKPIQPGELLARVSAVLAAGSADAAASAEDGVRRARRSLREGRLDEAGAELQQLRDRNVITAEIWNLLGVEAELRSEPNAAKRCYRLALDLDARYRPAQRNADRLAPRLLASGEPRAEIDLGDPDPGE
jgi:DNA-binding response OmpR family regulator